AFLDSDAMSKWMPPQGFTGKVHEMKAVVGGSYFMSFTNFSTGTRHTFGETFEELVANERIRYSNRLQDSDVPGETQVTITLKAVAVGTELDIVTQEGESDEPQDGHCFGWQQSLALLAQLVEAEIPD
ncbi:MAG: SRPBCC domain-containing protein, partial [Luteimonas sp.]|nr:SRPBCC domain-containing protein [Luteimonas sp.]